MQEILCKQSVEPVWMNKTMILNYRQQPSEFSSICIKGLVTHNNILKIYRTTQYSKNISKCNMVKNILKIYEKITFLLKKITYV